MNKILDDFNTLELKYKEYAILPLGQHSFAVKTAAHTIWLDPFLSNLEGRLIPAICKAEEITAADLITGSHDHADHIDRPALPDMVKASADSFFVFPKAISVEEVPPERTIKINDGECAEHNGIKISAVASAHEFLEMDQNGNYHALGYVIECDGVKFYHSGDCCIYEGLLTKLRQHGHFNFVFLPINGRDAVRYLAGCIGNMTWQEAVDLAGNIDVETAIPAHFDMFAFNSENPQKFADYYAAKYPAGKSVIPVPGKIITGVAN